MFLLSLEVHIDLQGVFHSKISILEDIELYQEVKHLLPNFFLAFKIHPLLKVLKKWVFYSYQQSYIFLSYLLISLSKAEVLGHNIPSKLFYLNQENPLP